MSEVGTVVVVGLGVAGEAAARRLAERGWATTVVEDRPGEATRRRAAALGDLGVAYVETPSPAELVAVVDGAELVVPSPGVPLSHPAITRARARHIPVWSELELAARWSDLAMVAVTGTNGKTTVTTLVERMLTASGWRTVAAGNNDLPLVDAVAGDPSLDVVVVEASSFGLAHTERFAPEVGVWLNQAEDHLDWHGTMEAYAEAKARVWAAQGPHQVAVANADDPTVMARTATIASRLVTFGTDGDWRRSDGMLTGPGGQELLAVDELWRSLPHDVANVLAAAAAAFAAWATTDGVCAALRAFRGLPHRLSRVAEVDGVTYYDDSKATDPHAAAAAVAGFSSVVLIAGGRNKGLDLSVLAELSPRLRAVVAIGEASAGVQRA
ncbi:MAG TPA: UDP-N-acetylmuramoyl-L-alanine--D-glutamate ligase, partial [Acidimicrobiales bacterium]|nr:UDP-N-acetylmuramoyl-L-alanine--D-glutamate ligase [Acidimicrobiales bacterium]